MGGQDVGQLSIEVANGLNGEPVAHADTLSIDRDEAIQIAPLENDIDPNLDPISITSMTQPIYGTAVLQGDKVQYTPMASFIGIDSFEYTIQDSFGDSATTIITVAVALENTEIIDVDPNATQSQSFTTEDGRLAITIPVDALDNSVQQIAYTTLESTSGRGLSQGIGLSFALNVGNGSQIFMGSPIFSPPLEITIRYDPNLLPNGVDEDNLQIFYFDESISEWVGIDIIARDTINKTVTAQVSHFTDFSLGASYTIHLPVVIK